ncbi:MAG: pili assembly chaperone [Gammaproteobacteria bacterium]|nr:pili assembly chaperone [Gammaproteobacteria bacterium]
MVFAIYIASICSLTSVNLQADETQVGRYSLLAATPTEAQADLLAAKMTIQFPERIQTVGEAVHYLLQRSGYRLATHETAGSETHALFMLPLPAVHQSLGPMMLRDALKTLAGPAFSLVQDPVHRLITFELCMTSRQPGLVTGMNVEQETAKDEE